LAHSFTRIWVHAVWATKERAHLIYPKIEKELHAYLAQQLEEMGCKVRIINGMEDHVHCLFHLNPVKSLAEVIKQLKGSSAHWINHENLIPEKFSWQTGYSAFAVSSSVMLKTENYIRNQKIHHARITSVQEESELQALNENA
jgi:putative transposase